MGRTKEEGLLHRLDFLDCPMLVKLRPFVREFLREANKMFDLYVYTMGTRDYAIEVVKLLDPENKYFPSKVISRSDCTRMGQKALDIVPGSRACTIILDDNLSVCFFIPLFSFSVVLIACQPLNSHCNFRYGRRRIGNIWLKCKGIISLHPASRASIGRANLWRSWESTKGRLMEPLHALCLCWNMHMTSFFTRLVKHNCLLYEILSVINC